MEQSLLPPLVVDISTIMGIVGFCITILGFIFTYVIFDQTKEIRTRFISKARLPQLRSDLSQSVKSVLDVLNQPQYHSGIFSAEVSKCAGIVESVLVKVNGSEREAAKSLLSKLRYRKWFIGRYTYVKFTTSQSAWDIYTELNGFTTKLAQFIKDSHWE